MISCLDPSTIVVPETLRPIQGPGPPELLPELELELELLVFPELLPLEDVPGAPPDPPWPPEPVVPPPVATPAPVPVVAAGVSFAPVVHPAAAASATAQRPW